jgi:hypothetical protein
MKNGIVLLLTAGSLTACGTQPVMTSAPLAGKPVNAAASSRTAPGASGWLGVVWATADGTDNMPAAAQTTLVDPPKDPAVYAAVYAKLEKRVPWMLMNYDSWENKPTPADPNRVERDGRVSLAEFQRLGSPSFPRNYFSQVDANRDGYLTEAEGKAPKSIQLYFDGMRRVSPGWFNQVDLDHDQTVNFSEWEAAVITHCPEPADKPILRQLFLEAAGGIGGKLTRKQIVQVYWKSFAKTSM